MQLWVDWPNHTKNPSLTPLLFPTHFTTPLPSSLRGIIFFLVRLPINSFPNYSIFFLQTPKSFLFQPMSFQKMSNENDVQKQNEENVHEENTVRFFYQFE